MIRSLIELLALFFVPISAFYFGLELYETGIVYGKFGHKTTGPEARMTANFTITVGLISLWVASRELPVRMRALLEAIKQWRLKSTVVPLPTGDRKKASKELASLLLVPALCALIGIEALITGRVTGKGAYYFGSDARVLAIFILGIGVLALWTLRIQISQNLKILVLGSSVSSDALALPNVTKMPAKKAKPNPHLKRVELKSRRTKSRGPTSKKKK